MASHYRLAKVQELVRRIQLEEDHAAEQYKQITNSLSFGEARAYKKVLRIIKDIFGPDAMEKKEGKE